MMNGINPAATNLHSRDLSMCHDADEKEDPGL